MAVIEPTRETCRANSNAMPPWYNKRNTQVADRQCVRR